MVLLDISENNLSGNAGMYIGQILSAHAKRRDDIIWMSGLRNEEPTEEPAFKGLIIFYFILFYIFIKLYFHEMVNLFS